MRKRLACLAITALLTAAACRPPRETASVRLAGCYALRRTAWSPAPGGDSVYSLPPDTIRLATDSTSVPEGWWRASPVIAHPYVHSSAWASWQPTSPSSFRVVWSDGFTGAELRLERRSAREYWGSVVAMSDKKIALAAAPRAAVIAQKVPCLP